MSRAFFQVAPYVLNSDKAKKRILFVSGLRKNRVGRLVKKNVLHYFFGQKCVFYA